MNDGKWGVMVERFSPWSSHIWHLHRSLQGWTTRSLWTYIVGGVGGRVGDVLDEFVVESVGRLIGQMEVHLNVPFN